MLLYVPTHNLCCANKVIVFIVLVSACQYIIYFTAVIREQSVEAPSTDSRESSPDVHPSPAATTDSRESSPDVHPSPAATTDSSEVVSDLQEKLNKCLAKKRLYKDLYRGEKSNNASMQEHYHEEMKVCFLHYFGVLYWILITHLLLLITIAV